MAMALIMLSLLLWTGTRASGQTIPPQGDNDTKGWQIADMDKFLDSHPEIAEQLQKDPSLIKNDEFVAKHPALQDYLQEHRGIREEFTENPRAFMRQEERFDRHEDADGHKWDRDITREELANTDRFMDSHPEIAEQLQKNPTLIKNKDFVEKHPALQEFLQTHPGVREEFAENPNAFMRRENRFDQHEDQGDRRIGDRDDRNTVGDRDDRNTVGDRDNRNTVGDRDNRNTVGDRDVTRGELANMDRFMDSHPEISEQLQKDPSLIKNKEFVEKHPALQEFLQTHPEVREEARENPNTFMRQERRFDEREDSRSRTATSFHDRDHDRGNLTSFGQFLGGHATLAQQLSKDPSLANNKEFLANHAELQAYLKAHPEVTQELAKNPQAVMTSTTPQPATSIAPSPKLDPKPKQ